MAITFTSNTPEVWRPSDVTTTIDVTSFGSSIGQYIITAGDYNIWMEEPQDLGGSVSLKTAIDQAKIEADEKVLERWAGNSDVLAVYDAILAGKLIVDARKLVEYPHTCRPQAGGFNRSHVPFAIAPVRAKRVSAMWSGSVLALTADTGKTQLIEKAPRKGSASKWSPPVEEKATWTRSFQTVCTPWTASANWATVPEVPTGIETEDTDFIFFEAQWEAPEPAPRDPALLRPIAGSAFEVIAVWDLTPLEAAALARF